MTSATSMIGWACGLVALSLAGTAAAQSDAASRDPVNRADLQCLAVMSVGVGLVEDGSQEQMGLVGGLAYFLGRLEGRASQTDWLDQLAVYLEGDLEEEIKVQAQRCGEEMTTFGARLTNWGTRLQALAAKRDGATKQALRADRP